MMTVIPDLLRKLAEALEREANHSRAARTLGGLGAAESAKAEAASARDFRRDADALRAELRHRGWRP